MTKRSASKYGGFLCFIAAVILGISRLLWWTLLTSFAVGMLAGAWVWIEKYGFLDFCLTGLAGCGAIFLLIALALAVEWASVHRNNYCRRDSNG